MDTSAQAEAYELIDLGDATVETRQLHPSPFYRDNLFQWGTWPGYMQE